MCRFLIMDVRRAERGDLVPIGRIAHRASWDIYDGLVPSEAVAAVLDRRYSPSELKRRLLMGSLLVAVDEAKRVKGFLELESHSGHVVAAVSTQPGPAGAAAGSSLIAAVCESDPALPVCADIVLGNVADEVLHERIGFVPGEVVEDDIAGHSVIRRRWWLAPGTRFGGGTDTI